MEANWTHVKKEHVIQAIAEFEKLKEDYPKARNTFLLYQSHQYPAKHIRGLAYKIANKKEILKSDYSGGEETVRFFTNLGFNILYKGEKIISKVNRESRFAYDDESQIKIISGRTDK